MTIEESIHVTFDETNITSPRKEFVDDIADTLEDTQNEERNLKRKRDDEDKDDQDDTTQENDNLPKEWKTSRNHPCLHHLFFFSDFFLHLVYLPKYLQYHQETPFSGR